MSDYVELSWWQVGCSACLLAVNVVLSRWLDLGLGRSLLWASARMVAQLMLIGGVLSWIFSRAHPAWVLLMASVMTAIAGWTAASRDRRRYPGLRRNTLAAVWGSAWGITACAVWIIAGPEGDWFAPRHVIPLLGMILGNSLNAVSLASSTFSETIVAQRSQVEGLLTLGATRWEAARFAVQQALRTGLTPTIHTMSVVGLVSLPGMMTGQLLSGTAPAQAIRYQMVIMFCISAATALAATGAVLLAYRSLTNARHQLVRWDE